MRDVSMQVYDQCEKEYVENAEITKVSSRW